MLLVVSYAILQFLVQSEALCTSKVFCQGPLLHMVQTARIFPDSKTFVDMKMLNDEKTTLQKFNTFRKTYRYPTRKQIRKFVQNNFIEHEGLQPWLPTDFTRNPAFLRRIQNNEVREFAQELVDLWPKLARKVNQEVISRPELYTLLPVKKGFVVPGGRFREFYYWDSYWIIRGLLLCEMYDTVRGMLDNFISLVQKFGFVPNGARIYYLNRSQPPLLTFMVAEYLEATNDVKWLRKNIAMLDKELMYFLEKKSTGVVKNGVKYSLAHYVAEDGTPRPESYDEDLKTASYLHNEEDKTQLYIDLKSAAESGWDFSSRWIIDEYGNTNGNLTSTRTTRIIPADLNAFLCKAFKIIANFYKLLKIRKRALFWSGTSIQWMQTIEQVLYDREDGIWYDWDNELHQPRKIFYPSNFAPLWANVYNLTKREELGKRAAEYLINKGILELDGGIPTSLIDGGEQWDYPNIWPPLQSLVIFGLDKTGNAQAQKVAEEIAKKWIEFSWMSFSKTGKMFEKYNVLDPGKGGTGGEYEVQTGFGWTNGVVLELINRYYTSEYN